MASKALAHARAGTIVGVRRGRWGAVGVRLVAQACLLFGAAWMALPFLWMLSSSVKTDDVIFRWPPLWIPTTIVWSNYAEVFHLLPMTRFILNSSIVAVSVTLGQLVFCSLSAFAFARLQFWGRDTIFAIYLATLMIPFHIRLVPVFLVMKVLGWLDTYQVLIVPGLFSVYGTFLFRQFFLTIPQELEDAARIDGCTSLGVLRHVILPLSGPVLATLGLFTFLAEWNDFLWPLVMTSSLNMRTVQVGLALLQNEDFTRWTVLMAGSVISLVPTTVLFLLTQRYFVRGITITGMK